MEEDVMMLMEVNSSNLRGLVTKNITFLIEDQMHGETNGDIFLENK